MDKKQCAHQLVPSGAVKDGQQSVTCSICNQPLGKLIIPPPPRVPAVQSAQEIMAAVASRL